MQLFRSEDEVDKWSEVKGHPKGAVFSPAQLWDLAQGWYDDRLDFDWRRKTLDERQGILTAVGLTGDFWELRGS